MLKFILYYVLFGFFTFIAGTVAAFVYLEWWQAILVSLFTFCALLWFGKLYVRYRIKRFGTLFQEMFLMKSRVLRGAAIELHSVTRASQPQRPLLPPGEQEADEEDEEEEAEEDATPEEADSADDPEEDDDEAGPEPADYYCIDVSIIPGKTKGLMEHWDLSDLRLVDVRTRVPSGLEDEGLDDVVDFDPQEMEIEEQGRFVLVEGLKYQGRQRVRFLVGVPEGVRELKFHYYFEEFGRVPLPGR